MATKKHNNRMRKAWPSLSPTQMIRAKRRRVSAEIERVATITLL